MSNIELGLDTFGDVTLDPAGRLQPQARVLRDVIAEAKLADRVSVDFFGVGEHHRPDFAISAPEGSSPPSPAAPSTSDSAPPSPSSAPTTRSAAALSS